MRTTRHISRAMAYYAGLVLAYLVLSTVLPASKDLLHTYHLTNIEYHVLLLFVVFPLAIIWMIAFYGYSTIKGYNDVIQDSAESRPMEHISNGLMWLAWGLPISSIASLILTAMANRNHGFMSASVIITNYISLVFPVLAYHVMSTGTRLWMEHEKLRISVGATKLLVFWFVVIGSLYTYLVFHNSHTGGNPYHLPHWLLISTIVVPYLYAWFMGFLAAYEMSLVGKHSPGLLYQQALRNVSRGLVVIVLSSIALQYFATSISPQTGKLSLSYVLVAIYILLTIIALGYVLLAYGARKLKKIEEV